MEGTKEKDCGCGCGGARSGNKSNTWKYLLSAAILGGIAFAYYRFRVKKQIA